MANIKFGTETLGQYKYLKVTAPDNIRTSTILKAISDKYTWKQLEAKNYVISSSGITNIQLYIKSSVGTLPFGRITRKMLADWYKMEKKPYRNSLGKIVE